MATKDLVLLNTCLPIRVKCVVRTEQLTTLEQRLDLTSDHTNNTGLGVDHTGESLIR